MTITTAASQARRTPGRFDGYLTRTATGWQVFARGKHFGEFTLAEEENARAILMEQAAGRPMWKFVDGRAIRIG